MSDIIQIIGRFHPLVLHLPIGILVYAFLLSIYQRYYSKSRNKNSLDFALGLAAISSVISAGTGYLLSTEGGYDEDLLNWHKYLGIALAVGTVGLFYLYKTVKDSNLFLLAFSLIMLLLALTGHDGGSLTHGKDFLTADKTTETKVLAMQDPNTLDAFMDVVMPIMEQKCVSCHNTQKMKGELLMTSIADWQKGGKNGPILMPGDLANSHMMQRIHTPKEEKEHMPPAGKLQLANEEIKILEWWITNMKSFDHKVGDLNPNKFVLEYIQSKMTTETADAPMPDEEALLELQKIGYSIIRMSKDSPWLHVDLSRIPVSKSNIKGLSKIKDNIQFIDLTDADIKGSHLSALSDFKNLEVLKLGGTMVKSKDLDFLEDLPNLKSLNLHNTNVNDQIVDLLKEHKKLEKLYLWKSKVTQSGFERLEKANPSLFVNNGETEVFGDGKLSGPIIAAGKDIFADTLTVSLSTVLNNSTIYYTLDGKDPDTTSMQYTVPILLNSTTELKAIVTKEGWLQSDPVAKTYIMAKYKIDNIKLNNPPAEKYAAEGGKTLINFVKGSEVFTDGNWLGFSGLNCNAILDLGGSKEIKRVAVSALEDYVSYIFYPRAIEVSISDDGKVYNQAGIVTYEELKEPRPKELNSFLVDFEPKRTRYVKVEIKNQSKNPTWHPAPGADAWLFVDEITVE